MKLDVVWRVRKAEAIDFSKEVDDWLEDKFELEVEESVGIWFKSSSQFGKEGLVDKFGVLEVVLAGEVFVLTVATKMEDVLVDLEIEGNKLGCTFFFLSFWSFFNALFFSNALANAPSSLCTSKDP